jgi:hypothetical protein
MNYKGGRRGRGLIQVIIPAFARRTGSNHEQFVRITRVPIQIQTGHLPSASQKPPVPTG